LNYEALISPQAQGVGIAGGRRVRGPGDGMSDSIRTSIDGKQPAALSSGEYVIDADVVAFLGNGDNEAGAKALDAMIARIRQAKTGRTARSPHIDPRQFMPV